MTIQTKYKARDFKSEPPWAINQAVDEWRTNSTAAVIAASLFLG